MTTTTKTRRRYLVREGFGLPAAAGAVPPPVREASDRLRELVDKITEARREVKAARAAIDQADAADRAAEAEAVAANKPVPKRTAGPKARGALDAAGRKIAALQQAHQTAGAELANLIAESREAWLPEQRRATSDAEDEARAAIATLSGAFARLRTERSVLLDLEKFPVGGGTLQHVTFGRVSAHDEKRAEAKRRRAEEKVRRMISLGGRPRDYVPRDLNSTLGNLHVLADELAGEGEAGVEREEDAGTA